MNIKDFEPDKYYQTKLQDIQTLKQAVSDFKELQSLLAAAHEKWEKQVSVFHGNCDNVEKEKLLQDYKDYMNKAQAVFLKKKQIENLEIRTGITVFEKKEDKK